MHRLLGGQSELPLSMSAELIVLLDPNRSYGERDYDEVVEGV